MDKALLLLLLTPLLAGCVEVSPDGAVTEESSETVTVHEESTSTPAPPPDCDTVAGAHVVWVQADGHYVAVDPGAVLAYRESNGVRGLQTQESCPDNPDERLA